MLDKEFQSFLKKIGQINDDYSKSLSKKISWTVAQVGQKVDCQYWSYYQRFKETFGMKLNYSLHVSTDGGKDLVKIQKRKPKSSFKQAESSVFSFTFLKDSTVENKSPFDSNQPSFQRILDIPESTDQVSVSAKPLTPLPHSQATSVMDGAIGDDMSIIRKETVTQSPRAAGFLSPPLQDLLQEVQSNDLNSIIKAQVEAGSKLIEKRQSFGFLANLEAQRSYFDRDINDDTAEDLAKFVGPSTFAVKRSQRDQKMKQGLDLLQKVAWRKQTHFLFSSWFCLRATQYVKGIAKEQSENLSSVGQSTMPTNDRGRGRHYSPHLQTTTMGSDYASS